MNTLKLELENCYGIQKMQQDIDFSKNNVAVIYAPNGTMKSSFAKTFEAIRDGKTVEEKVYGCKSKYSITDETATAISPESIMVINPFDKSIFMRMQHEYELDEEALELCENEDMDFIVLYMGMNVCG